MKNIYLPMICATLLWSCQSKTSENSTISDQTKTRKGISANSSSLVYLKTVHHLVDRNSHDSSSKNHEAKNHVDQIDYGISWRSIAVPAQTYTCNMSRSNKIYGRKGTIIDVPLNSLYDKHGNPVKGEVTFKLKEYYSASDLIKSKIGTCSNGKMLTTGGSIDLEAYQKGEKLSIDKKNPMQIYFPVRLRIIKDMLPFIGKRTNRGVNWVEDKGPKVDPHLCISKTFIHYHIFDGLFCKKGISVEEDFCKTFENTKCSMDSNLNLRVSYSTTPMGKTENVEIHTEHCSEKTKKMIMEYFLNLELDINQGLTNKPFWTHVVHDIKLSTNLNKYDNIEYIVAQNESRNSFTPQMVRYRKNDLVYIEPGTQRSFYKLPMRNFGLLNCDAYSRDPRPKTNILVHTPNLEHSVSMIIIPTKRGIIMSYEYNNNSVIPNIPIGEPCILVTMNISDDKVYFDKRSIVVQKDQILRIVPKEMSKGMIEKSLASVDDKFANMSNNKSRRRLYQYSG